MWKAMLVDGTPAKVVNISCNYYEGAECTVRVYGEFTDSFNVTTGVQQGYILFPLIFNIIIDWIMNRADARPFVVGKDLSVQDLDYADDIALLADTAEGGQTFLHNVASVAAKLGLRISRPKTKVVSFGYDAPAITVDGMLEVVPAFVYPGSSISGDSTASSDDVECWIGKAAGAFARLKVCVWKRRNIRLTTKMKIFNAVVITTLLYASECWTVLATDLTKLEIFQMSCLRQILGVTRCDRLRNDTIRHRCKKQPTVGKWVQWNRLRSFSHVCQMDDSRLPKCLLWAERPDGWRCPPNAPKKQWKDQVAADVSTQLTRRLYRDPLQGDSR